MMYERKPANYSRQCTLLLLSVSFVQGTIADDLASMIGCAHFSGLRSLSSSWVSSSRLAAFRYSFSSSGTIAGTFSRYLIHLLLSLARAVIFFFGALCL